MQYTSRITIICKVSDIVHLTNLRESTKVIVTTKLEYRPITYNAGLCYCNNDFSTFLRRPFKVPLVRLQFFTSQFSILFRILAISSWSGMDLRFCSAMSPGLSKISNKVCQSSCCQYLFIGIDIRCLDSSDNVIVVASRYFP